MKRLAPYIALFLLLLSPPTLSDESTFSCKRIDTGITHIFSGTSMLSIDSAGKHSEPTDVTFSHAPNGSAPMWSTLDRKLNFVLLKNQIFVVDALGNTAGKIVCE